ncbi:hypothetical protein BHF71_00745 [Vulcanibacillus modesticaldus]|uniref:3-ketoacyl-ACP reductase n=2 Tax=Vulcanibacillus modesticaldus TaxID=337097 RepID=A0A1D2YXP5_9BACI|nr:hypothetical protein BHF71_00745 [Vulcanibacillus modesticaldus]
MITGASGTIGSAISVMLAEHGIDVILHYHKNKNNIDKVERICKDKGVNTYVIQGDLTKIEQIEMIFKKLESMNLYPNILINNAGIAQYGLVQDIDFVEWKKVIDSHVLSTFFCSQKVIPEMIRQKYGRIVNISSVWGDKGAANEVAYSMAKGAVNTFTKALAKELAPSGITVNAIAPGIVFSPMMVDFTQEEIEILKNEIPMGRFAKAKEIAHSVLYLLHPNSSYITGQIINIDGGWN